MQCNRKGRGRGTCAVNRVIHTSKGARSAETERYVYTAKLQAPRNDVMRPENVF